MVVLLFAHLNFFCFRNIYFWLAHKKNISYLLLCITICWDSYDSIYKNRHLKTFWAVLSVFDRFYKITADTITRIHLSPTAWLNRYFYFQLDSTHRSILQSPRTSDFRRSLLRCSFKIHLFQKLIYFWLVHKKNIWFRKFWFGHAYLSGNRSLFITRQSFILQQLIYFEISIIDK